MKTHIVYFDILRVIAILAVIMLHVAAANFNRTDIFSPIWEMSNIYNGLMRWGVPVFVMISGTLFLDPAREINFHKLYTKNILHVGFVLIFWSFLYALLYERGFNGNPGKILSHAVLGHFHLWFLYMLLGLYLIVPLLRPICWDTKLLRYFLVLSMFFSFFIPTVVRILTGLDLMMPDSVFAKMLKIVNSVTERTHFHFTLGYVAYFVLGYYVNQITLLPWQRKIIYVLGIGGGLFTIFFTQFISHVAKVPFEIYSNLTLNVLFEALAVLVFVKYHVDLFPAKIISSCTYLAKRVLGIYLLHVGILTFLKHCHIVSTNFNPLFSIPLIALLAFCLSWLSTEIIRRIPWLGTRII